MLHFRFYTEATRKGEEKKKSGMGTGAVSRLVNRGDLINGVIHHQFPWHSTTEANSPVFWRGEEGALSSMINLNIHSYININADC